MVLHERILRQFSVFPRIHAPILPKNYKRLQNVFNVVTNKDKTKTQNALCNFSKSPHMCKLLIVWLGTLCGLCIFALYMACVLRLLVWLIRLFMRSWFVWTLSTWERERVWRSCVFVSVDVKYIRHYKRKCKFIYSL